MAPSYEPIPADIEALASQIVDAAYKVHSALGPGLLESVYETCFAHELMSRGIEFKTQVHLPIQYRDALLDGALRLDCVVADAIIVELKAVDALHPLHKAQLMTYLKLARKRLGFLINFNVPLIRDGIERVVR